MIAHLVFSNTTVLKMNNLQTISVFVVIINFDLLGPLQACGENFWLISGNSSLISGNS